MRRQWTAALASLALVAAAMIAMLAIAPAAQAKTRTPSLIGLRCVPKTSVSCTAGVRRAVGQKIQLRGKLLRRGMRVSFRWSKGALASKLVLDKTGWTVRVPAGTAVGKVAVTVTDKAGRRSNVKYLTVIAAAPVATPSAGTDGTLPTIFAGNGMWIWYVNRSEGGDLDAIAARARLAGMSTVFVKSADGGTAWPQFGAELVAGLHLRGLHVCAWQFVYGDDPLAEAAAGAAAKTAGADCFVIDAESKYEGRYAQAQRYMTALRAAVGQAYPVGLTSFPYVDYHPRLPYSVFLAPGGAQANLPQVYWKDIGGSVDAVSAKTVANNRIYGVPIAPLGQTYSNPTSADLRRFRSIWAGYGSPGLSWWSWQATTNPLWSILSEAPPATVVPPDPGWPALDLGASGDQVIWLQQHLATADPTVKISGKMSAATVASLTAFQTARGLPPTGETDAATWQALLKLGVSPVDWTA